MKWIICSLLVSLGGWVIAQPQPDTLNRVVAPSHGVTGMVVKYYGIEFSKAQRESLKDVELELIFLVDAQGIPTLSEVNGTNDPAILDSLKRKTAEIPPFFPQLEAGRAVPSIYFIKFHFPRYAGPITYERQYLSSAYILAKREDFEYLHKTLPAAFIQFRGAGFQPLGKLSNYLATGGGLALDVLFVAPNRMMGGISMEPYFSKRTQAFPVQSPNQQPVSPSSIFVSFNVGKQYGFGDLRADIGVYTLNVTESDGGSQDTNFVQVNGLSLGVLYDYTVQLGKDVPAGQYGQPSVNSFYLDFHAGLRQVFTSTDFATGPMLTLGAGFRWGMFTVKDYKYKDEYLRRLENK